MTKVTSVRRHFINTCFSQFHLITKRAQIIYFQKKKSTVSSISKLIYFDLHDCERLNYRVFLLCHHTI